MANLQPIFKKAYWALAAGGLIYVLFICALTFPEVQRLYASPVLKWLALWLTPIQFPLRQPSQSQSLARCGPGRAIWFLKYVF